MQKERSIRVIQPHWPALEQYQRKRACAYVRVSTSHDAQLNSLQNQTEYYERKIKGTPGYVFSGIYSDSGIPGSKEDRPGFQAMMAAARKGQVDLILTKSVSRFARNAEMLLSAVRELKVLGIAVIFDENKINTLSAQGELFLTILASFAEEERKSVCKNIQWSIRNRYKQGNPPLSIQNLLGYRKDAKGNMEIDEEQAEIVRLIYRRYLAGDSAYGIAKQFNEEEMPGIKGKPWNDIRIMSILSNERYIGDCLLQKTYIADNGRQVLNKGQLPQYYIDNHHPAIISRDDWEAVQQRREACRKHHYPFSGMLCCAYCGATLIRVTAEKQYIGWKCATYLHHGKKACKGIKVPDRIVQAFHEKNPIIEPMVVEEADNAVRTQSRTLEHYHFSPLSFCSRPGR